MKMSEPTPGQMRRSRMTGGAPDTHPDLGIEPNKFLATMLPSPPATVRIDVERGVVSLMQQRGRGKERKRLRVAAREAHTTLTKAVTVRARMAENPEDLEAARHLLRRRYAWRGYGTSVTERAAPTAEAERPSITFIATLGNATVGTLTIGFDSAHGLLAEVTHTQVVERHRASGSCVCELTGLALAERVDSKSVLASLFSLAYAAGKAHGVSDVFIEVNPRHVGFYTRVLGFTVAAEARICERVGAPSVLLCLRTDILESRIVDLSRGVMASALSAAA